MTNKEFQKRIRQQQWDAEMSPEEWYNPHNGNKFVKLGQRLIELGMNHEEALDFLYEAYATVSDEYGC